MSTLYDANLMQAYLKTTLFTTQKTFLEAADSQEGVDEANSLLKRCL